MQLKPYPEYKESGHPFLSKIPAHWDLFRNGRLFSPRNETGFGELPILEVSLKTGVRVRDMDNLKRKQVMADREKYKRAAQGDIAYNMMRMWQGAIGVAPVDGLVSPAYVVVKPFPEVDCRYFSYLFRTTAYMNEVDAYSRGIVKDRNRLYWQDFKRMPSVVPPYAEQRQIVRLLNDVGGKIQRFIRNKRRLIELLKEQKQHIINQAVTRGIDSNVKLKDSGAESIGDIPEHWETMKVGRIIDLLTGFPFKSEGFSTNGKETRLLRGINVAPLRLSWNDAVFWERRPNDGLEIFELREGDIVLGMDRPIIASGIRVAVVTREDIPCLLLQRVARIRPHSGIMAEYLLLFFSGRLFAEYIAPLFTGISVPHLSPEQIRNFRVMLPPLKEQATIVSHIKEETATIDYTITRAQREIELMREYRDRLIADVVTGQVDVRGIEVPETVEEAFPETADELDALDDLDEATTEDEA